VLLALGYVIYRVCGSRARNGSCTLPLEELVDVFERLRLRRYVVYTSPRELHTDLRILLHMLSRYRCTAEMRRGVIEIDSRCLTALASALAPAKGLLPKGLVERLSEIGVS